VYNVSPVKVKPRGAVTHVIGKGERFGYNGGMAGILVAAAQTAPRIGDVAGNLDEISRILKQAAGRGARLVIFPECALTGYNYDSRAEALPQAQTLPGPASQTIAAITREHNVYTIFGLLEKDGERLYNSAALLGPACDAGSVYSVSGLFFSFMIW